VQQNDLLQGFVTAMCSRTTWSSPRPQNFVLEVYSRSRPVLEDPHTWAFFTVWRYAELLCQVVCLSISLKFNALLPPLVRLCMKYCIYGIESFTDHTQKFNVLWPDLEAKVKATKFCPRGRGQSSRTPSLLCHAAKIAVPVVAFLYIHFHCEKFV